MLNFVLIIVCLITGILFSRLKLVPQDSYKGINIWLLYIAIPALSLRYVPYIKWNFDIIMLILGPVIVMAGGMLFIRLYSGFTKIDSQTRTALFVTCALGNTGFLGIPMVSAYFGEEHAYNAIIFDQVTFILFSTLAVVAVLRASAPKEMKRMHLLVLAKLLRFPPFIACITALVLPLFLDISPLNPLFDKLAATMSPLALFSVGLQLRFGEFRCELRNIIAGISYKLVIAPLLVLICAVLIGSKGIQPQVAVMEAAMPAHITASLMATQYNLNPRLCTLIVAISIFLSFITTFLWWLAAAAVFG